MSIHIRGLEIMNEISEVLKDARSAARKYRKLTGKSFGITSEFAELSAVQILCLELVRSLQSGSIQARKSKFK